MMQEMVGGGWGRKELLEQCLLVCNKRIQCKHKVIRAQKIEPSKRSSQTSRQKANYEGADAGKAGVVVIL